MAVNTEHCEKLEELVKDKNNIVTVPFYAATANIPWDESQKALEKFFEANRNSGKIHATYVLNGIRKDNGNVSVVQIKDEALKQQEKLYVNAPASVIFSIQKTNDIDFNIISSVQPKSDAFSHEFKKLLKKVLPPLPTATIKGKSTVFMKQNGSDKKANNCDIKVGKSEATSADNKSNGKSSMFMKQNSSAKKANNIDIKVEKSEVTPEHNKTQANSKGSITSLFNKAAQANAAKQKATEPKALQRNDGLLNSVTKQATKEIAPETVKPEELKVDVGECNSNKTIKTEHGKVLKKSDLFDSDTDEEIFKDLEIHDSKPVKSEVKPGPKKTSTYQKNKKRPSTSCNDKSAKKRRRIIVEESESDDMFASDQSENEMESVNDEPEPEKDVKPILPKNKRRKSVKKTYEDDEGFIVTQTEYVYETASEDENDPNNKIPRPEEKPLKNKTEEKVVNKSEKEISPNKAAKGKKSTKKIPAANQSTLTSFFKRK
ncbi:hypothetical protein HUJ04_011027 [Dendroctonus ponderosae]|nr:hypothetical protein HUJ04_011027 [Dendroctonus ponderosae]KAH1028286.1 hypothetical protein HUJ05_001657 [Dendroctonus ponderosae]